MDNVSYFHTHLMISYNYVTTFVTTGEDLFMTLLSLCDKLLKTMATIVKTC